MKRDDVRPNLSPIEQADLALARRLARHRHDRALRKATAFSKLADQPPLSSAIAAVIAWGFLAGDRPLVRRGAHLAASLAATAAIKAALKRALSRTRPNVLLDKGVYQVELLGPDDASWHSFPSGHTAGAVAVARAVARCWPNATLPAYAAAAAVGLVQVPRGSHFPSDVLVGALVGAAAEAAVNALLPPR